jgi:hypothetical protein
MLKHKKIVGGQLPTGLWQRNTKFVDGRWRPRLPCRAVNTMLSGKAKETYGTGKRDLLYRPTLQIAVPRSENDAVR